MKESASRIIDMHLHKSGTLEDPAGIIEHLNQNNVDVGFLIPNPLAPGKGLKEEKATECLKKWTGGPNNNRIVRIVSSWTRPVIRGMSVKEPDNKSVVATVEEHSDRLMAWIWVNPQKEQKQILGEVESLLKNPNAAGSKMHFGIFPVKISNETIREITDLTGKANKAMLIDVGTNPANMKGFDEFAKNHPAIPIIAAHLGSFLPEVVDSARKYENVHLDMAGYPITPANFPKILRKIPAEKIVFGSDATIGGSIADSLRNLDSLKLTPREKELILAGNIIAIVPKAGKLLENQK